MDRLGKIGRTVRPTSSRTTLLTSLSLTLPSRNPPLTPTETLLSFLSQLAAAGGGPGSHPRPLAARLAALLLLVALRCAGSHGGHGVNRRLEEEGKIGGDLEVGEGLTTTASTSTVSPLCPIKSDGENLLRSDPYPHCLIVMLHVWLHFT